MESESLIDLLLIEDDVRLADLTREYLEGHGIIVTLEKNGEQGLQQALRHRFDLVLLDLMLPDRDGISICQRLREHSDVPVIMITARGEEADRVLGLEIGADDYIHKPFSPRELLARVRSTVRRARGQSRPRTALVTAGDLILDPGPLTARLNGQQLDLTISISAKHPARSRFNIGKPLFMIFSARWKSDSTATTREDLYA